MAPTAGFKGKLGITTTSTTMTNVDYVAGARNVTFDRMRQLLETTSFANQTAGERAFIAGLKDVDASWDQDWDPADTPTGRLETAYGDGSSVWFQFSYNGTAGWKVECKVESIGIKDAVDAKLEGSVKLKATGAVATF